MPEPRYEIWGLDNTPSDMDGGQGQHREDCVSYAEACKARNEWQAGGKAAWIQDKETGEHIS